MESTPRLFELDNDALAVIATRPVYYRVAIRKRVAALAGRRSWDVYREVFAPAYDDVVAATGDALECVAVVLAFVEYVLGEPPPAQLRALIGRDVRAFGKSALYGYDQALAAGVEDPMAIHRYALTVARRVMNEKRSAPR